MIRSILEDLKVSYKVDVPVRSLTGMNQTNIFPLVAYPSSVDHLTELCRQLRGINYDIFGNLTNTYICQSYKCDLVIVTTHINDIVFKNNTVKVGCGYNLTKLSRELSQRGISGFTGFVGIPGTVGGAAINNSGAFKCEMKDVIIGCSVLTKEGEIKYYSNVMMNYRPRCSSLKGRRDFILLSVELDISKKADLSELNQTLAKQQFIRKNKIDGTRKSLGSVFYAPSLVEIQKRHKCAFLFKRILNIPNKVLIKNRAFGVWLQFFLLRYGHLAKHCDSFNRFCWDRDTKEADFFDYIDTMQNLAENHLRLEIEIRK